MSRLRRTKAVTLIAIGWVIVMATRSSGWATTRQITSTTSPYVLGASSTDDFEALGWRAPPHRISSPPIIGKCTMQYGDYFRRYDEGLETHYAHAKQHGYPTYVLDRPIVDHLWSKQALLLHLILQELTKAEGTRLEWLLWFDADTIVMNRNIYLEAFLPPADLADIHLLYTKDWNGLNSGVFLLRVSPWAVEFLSAILALPAFRPKEWLRFTEQTAMERVIELDRFRNGTVECPLYWFNAKAPGWGDGGDSDYPGELYECRPGRFLVHLAGKPNKLKDFAAWHSDLQANRSQWEVPWQATSYLSEIPEFWHDVRAQRQKKREAKEKWDFLKERKMIL